MQGSAGKTFCEWLVFCKEMSEDLAAPQAASSGNAVLAMTPWSIVQRHGGSC